MAIEKSDDQGTCANDQLDWVEPGCYSANVRASDRRSWPKLCVDMVYLPLCTWSRWREACSYSPIEFYLPIFAPLVPEMLFQRLRGN